MTTQMQTISVRVPADDVAWLASLELNGATTPSDKLRALITQMRRQREDRLEYTSCVAWLRDLLGPFINSMRAVEHKHRIHSEPLALVVEWIPQVLAVMLSESEGGKDTKQRALEIEDRVLDGSFQVLASLLRLGVTRQASCFDPEAYDRYVSRVMEISRIVRDSRELKTE